MPEIRAGGDRLELTIAVQHEGREAASASACQQRPALGDVCPARSVVCHLIERGDEGIAFEPNCLGEFDQYGRIADAGPSA